MNGGEARTKDEVSEVAAERLFKLGKTPQGILRLKQKEIESLIYPVGFYKVKAERIKEIANIIIKEYSTKVPDEIDELLKFKGVGRKTANLVVTLGYKKPGICVDTHVHRITNRWGYVETGTPDKTEFVLRSKLPQKYWLEINGLLVSFGQGICKPIAPICSKCKIERYCDKVGVKKYR